MYMAVLAFVVDGILRAAFVVRHDAPRPRRLLGHRYDVIAIAWQVCVCASVCVWL
jgi:hypothetical protein